MPTGPAIARLATGALLAVLALVALANAAAAFSKCDCRDCLKLMKLETLNERRIYGLRWPKTEATLQQEIELYNTKPKYKETVDAQGGLFCTMWGLLEDELAVVRELEIPAAAHQVFDDHKQCLGAVGGSTDPLTCELDALMNAVDELKSPCQEIHLAILAHELVHVRDCQARKVNADFLASKGASCREAFKDKTPPTPEQLIAFAKTVYSTELNAHLIESQVLKLLSNELAKQCKKDEYSATLPDSYPDARDFLRRARDYKIDLSKVE